MNNLVCKAASPDNKFELQAIVDLLKAVYGESFPLPGVYDPQFWHQHIGHRFTSILVYRGRQLVGHLAAQREGADGRMIQILYPLCHPDYREESEQILGAAWALLEKQCLRQQWHGIYFFSFAHTPEMVAFGERTLRVRRTALCPAYFPSSNLKNQGARKSGSRSPAASRTHQATERTDIIIGQRFFAPEQEKMHSIFVNEQHHDLVSKLYHSIGLPRDIKTSASREKLSSYPLPADRSAIETRYFSQSGIMHAYVEPSLLTSDSELATHFQRPHSISTFVFVKAYDPRALETAQWLENHGYEFSGILPHIHDRESLLFSHTTSESSFRAEDAETLLLSEFSLL